MISVCSTCGRTAETRTTVLRQNIGALVGRLSKRLEGDLCRGCVLRRGASMTLVTILIGWLGVVSLLVAPFYVVANLVAMVRALGMRSRDGTADEEPSEPALELRCPWCATEFQRRAHGRATLNRCPGCEGRFEISVVGETRRILCSEPPGRPTRAATGPAETASDPYAVLGVDRDADARTIRKAYIRLIRRHTPEDDPETFRRVTGAHRVLSDPRSRAEYDGAEHLPEEVERRLQEIFEATEGHRAYELAEALLAGHGHLEAVQAAAAAVFLRTERPARALQILTALAEGCPTNARYAKLLAVAHFESGREERAIAQARKAMALDPGDVDVYVTLARFLDRGGQHVEALAVLDRGIGADGATGIQDLPLLLQKIVILGDRRDYHGMHTTARVVFDSVAEDDSDARAYVADHFRALAGSYHEAGLPHLTKFAVDMALRATPGDEDLRIASVELRAESRRFIQDEEACGDETVPGWIRELLGAHRAERTAPDRRAWMRELAAHVAGQGPGASAREWAEFGQRYPDLASSVEETWVEIRDAAVRRRTSARWRAAGGAS